MKLNEIKLNGQTFSMSREEAHSLCLCGHIKLGHIHYNGGLGLPDGTPTYCGYGKCPCDKFRDRKYPTTEGDKSDFERKFERIINLFATIEIVFGYALPSDFCDEFITSVRDARDYCKDEDAG